MTSPGSRRLEQIRSAVTTYQSRLIAFVARITGDTDSAREVVQETFLRLCGQDVDALADHLAPWLFRVCRNKALDARRKEAPLRSLDEAVTAPIESDLDPHRALERHDEAREPRPRPPGLQRPQEGRGRHRRRPHGHGLLRDRPPGPARRRPDPRPPQVPAPASALIHGARQRRTPHPEAPLQGARRRPKPAHRGLPEGRRQTLRLRRSRLPLRRLRRQLWDAAPGFPA
jgi:hypothetical protein